MFVRNILRFRVFFDLVGGTRREFLRGFWWMGGCGEEGWEVLFSFIVICLEGYRRFSCWGFWLLEVFFFLVSVRAGGVLGIFRFTVVVVTVIKVRFIFLSIRVVLRVSCVWFYCVLRVVVVTVFIL